MHISNLNELLNTQILNKGSTLSVSGFSLDLHGVKTGFAFFSDDEEEIVQAIKRGAFVIISQRPICVEDKEIYILKSENLENALLRLLRYLSEQRQYKFLFCTKRELEFCKIFNLKILQKNPFLDFNSLNAAKKGEIFCLDNKNYLLRLCVNYEILRECKLEKFPNSSPFYTSLICNDLYFKNLKLPFIYAQLFAQFVFFLQENQIEIRFDLNKLDLFRIYFVNEAMQIVEFGRSSRVFIVVENVEEMEFWKENFKGFRNFKIALKNSLFCDFSYNELGDLKKNKDFTYCMVLENMSEFEHIFKIHTKHAPSLF